MKNEIKYDEISRFLLDSENPRINRDDRKSGLTQEEILSIMEDWSLEELATSFIKSGFWAHEAILCIAEKQHLIVVEGNRRLAALIYLKQAYEGDPTNDKWAELVDSIEIDSDLFNKIPYIQLENRHEIDAFLGFRHVTGIKEWKPAEKAEYIHYLINKRGMSYSEVTKSIGSRIDAVRRNYIAFSVLLQMEKVEEIDLKAVEKRFSVLFLSLRSPGVLSFLNINIEADIEEAKTPVDGAHKENLIDYTLWLFGNDERKPLFTDSRDVDKFGYILASEDSVSYLRKATIPNFRKAYILSGGELSEIIELLEVASYNISDSLSYIHRYPGDQELGKLIDRILEDANELNIRFKGK